MIESNQSIHHQRTLGSILKQCTRIFGNLQSRYEELQKKEKELAALEARHKSKLVSLVILWRRARVRIPVLNWS